MDRLVETIMITVAVLVIALIGYSLVGTSGDVDEIREKAPSEMAKRNWKIIRYEGYTYGSWGNHGGKVWYHVANIDNENIQYRVYITIWGGELQWNYGDPEILQRFEVDLKQ